MHQCKKYLLLHSAYSADEQAVDELQVVQVGQQTCVVWMAGCIDRYAWLCCSVEVLVMSVIVLIMDA